MLGVVRGGHRPVKPDRPPEPTTRPRDSYRRIRILLFFFFGFRAGHGFHDFDRVSTRPARPFKYPLKKTSVYLSKSFSPPLSLFLSPSRCSVSRSQALPISPSSVLTLSGSLSLPPSVSSSSAYGGHE
jgi:hypothetical protein